MATTNDWQQARAWAEAQDAADPLARLRADFVLPRGGDGGDSASGVYCCSHSLGLEPRAAACRIEEVLATWGASAVEGHFTGAPSWAEYAAPLEAMSARLAGARPHEVAVMNALTVNLHLMLATFYRPCGERRKILIERPAFPSDRYAVVSHLRRHGADPAADLIQVGPRPGGHALRPGDLLDAIARAGDSLALVLVGAVNYFSGQVFDLAAVTGAAHATGAVAGFDLAHAIGNIPIALHDSGADFAVWCGYKYLCGGPGAPGGCFIHERHGLARPPLPRLAGWWGNRAETRFEMRDEFEPAPGAAGWHTSSPSLLALAALRAGLEAYDAVPVAAWQARAQALAAAFRRWSVELCPGLRSVTPADAGAQHSLELGDRAAAAQQRLRQAGIYTDVRGPILRLSFHPLYSRHADIIAALAALAAAG